MPDSRKQSILGLTDELLSQAKRAREQKSVLDEATVDSTFVLTFDRFCLEMLCNVRSMLRAIVQQNGSLPFDQEDGWKFYLHLELHKGLKVINDLQPDHQTWRFTHPTDKGYQLFNTSSAIKAIVIPYQSTKVLEHWKYIGEALQIVQIADKIDRLA
ncbi:MAG TPA: hypothetical protein VKE41_05005, partial [Roseiflexaceae bacterium]|nr:hypothetical protein [Roseiflexaceae bacterium]